MIKPEEIKRLIRQDLMNTRYRLAAGVMDAAVDLWAATGQDAHALPLSRSDRPLLMAVDDYIRILPIRERELLRGRPSWEDRRTQR